jgi:hypothetical protein
MVSHGVLLDCAKALTQRVGIKLNVFCVFDAGENEDMLYAEIEMNIFLL